MFLVPTLPHDATRIGTYCEALLAAFDQESFERFYADQMGRILENEIDTKGGFQAVLFRLLLKAQYDGSLRELLVSVLCHRAGTAQVVDILDDVLAVQPIVKLATFLAERQYPPHLGQDIVDALYEERLVRKRPWVHREGCAAWIEVLVVCDKLPAIDEPFPPLIACLNKIDHKWKPRNGAITLRAHIDRICRRYGIPTATGSLIVPGLDSSTAIPRARAVEETATDVHGVRRERRVLPTLRTAWRAATSDGQGDYLLAMVCFGLAAFLFHHSLNPQKLEQEYLKRNLSLQLESWTAQQQLPVDALLLPTKAVRDRAGVVNQKLCDSELSEVLDDMYEAFQREVSQKDKYDYKYKLHRTGEEAPGPGSYWTDSDPSTTLLIPSSLTYRLEKIAPPLEQGLAPASRASGAPPVSKLPGSQLQSKPTGAQPGRPLTGLQPGLRQSKPDPTRNEPALIPEPCTQAESSERLRCEFRPQIERSLAISALERFRREHRKISSIYFISLEGIQRSIPQVNPSLLQARSGLHGERLVHQAFSRSGDTFAQSCGVARTGRPYRIWTSPYFAPGGSGVYETVCYPLDTPISAGYAGMVGILCADIAVPREVVLARLEEASKMFDLAVLKLTKDGSRLDVQSCRDFSASYVGAESEGPCPPEFAKLDDEKAKTFARKFHASADRGAPDLGGVATLEGGNYFGAVVAADAPDQGPWYVVIGKFRTSVSRNYISLVLCMFTMMAAVTVLVLSFRRKLKRQQALLARGLHYGILEIEDGRIIGANDRAEEILLTPLPRLGAGASRKLTKKTLGGMLEEGRCVLVPANGQLRESDIRTYHSTIRDRDSDGLTSTFYAWVKQRRGWIKIVSTVILMPDDREHVLCTLDTNIDEAHRLFLANVRQGDESDVF